MPTANRTLPLALSFFLLASTAAWTAPVLWQAAHAADEERKPNVRTKRTPAMREAVYQQLNRAREAASEDRYEDAMKDVQGLLKSSLNSYEAAMAYNLVAYIHYSRDNTRGAIEAYEQVLAQEALPDSLLKNTLYSLAQIYIVSEQYGKGIDALKRWFALEEQPNLNAYVLLGQAHFQLKQYDKALAPIEKAVAMARADGETVRENWLLLLRAIYYSKQDYARMRDVLKELVALYPKAEYWSQLSAVYGELGERKKQLAAMEAAYDQGLFTRGQEYRNLAQLLLANSIPYKAATVMSEAFAKDLLEQNRDNLRTLADAWMLAKEYDRAEEALARAANLSADGDLYLRLAQIHTEQGEWQSALKAVNEALKRGGMDRADQAHVVKGLALFNLNRLSEAKSAFAAAARYETTAATARQWTRYIEREQERLAALERAGRAQDS